MAEYELLLPKMGESVAEATIIKWVKKPGDVIRIDDEIVEIATDKVDSEVPSPVKGKLKRQIAKENEVIQVGGLIAIIETEDEIIQELPAEDVEEPDIDEEPLSEEIPGLDRLSHTPEESRESFSNDPSYLYSPLVRSIAAEEGVSTEELHQIKGTGLENRITKQDILEYISNRGVVAEEVKGTESGVRSQESGVQSQGSGVRSQESKVESPKSEDASVKLKAESSKPKAESSKLKAESSRPKAESSKLKAESSRQSDEIIEMDRMRKMIAEHMVLSKQVSPHVNSFIETDVTNIVLWRDRIKGDFERLTGEKITFTPIFIEAVAKAIRDFPMINISVKGTQIIKKKDINIGMATALPSGNLIVPVIKKADTLSLTEMAKAVNDLANRARSSKLLPDDVQDGTFTITNIGSFGNIMGTPIINQPQVAIMAFGAIKKKPAVIETKSGDMIAIRHMMFISMAYDHRVVDGALGGLFIKKVSDYLEAWDADRKV